MAAEWFVAKVGGAPVGPLSPQQVKQMADAGQLQGSDLVWKEGLPQWVPAIQVKGLLSGTGSGLGMPPAQSEKSTPLPAPAPATSTPPADKVVTFTTADEPAAERDRDPWYYGFLETYAKVFLWLGIAACVLGFLGFLAPAIYVTFASAAGGSSAAFLQALVVVLAALLTFGLAILMLVFWTALVLLAVDAGRNLRNINRRAQRR
jgi:hypothetical protein